MTGTAQTEAEEFAKIYKLEVGDDPDDTARSSARMARTAFTAEQEKWDSILEDQGDLRQGSPGARRHDERREERDALDAAQAQARHRARVLNAKYHEREEQIVQVAAAAKNSHGETVGNVTNRHEHGRSRDGTSLSPDRTRRRIAR